MPGITQRVVGGLGAGAVGNVALAALTYADMLLTGRDPSSVPDRAADRSARMLGIDLGGPAGLGDGPEDPAGRAGNRRIALGSLMGIGTGLAGGVVYALGRNILRRRSVAATGLLTGMLVMAGSDVPAVLSGLTTNPRKWTVHEWLSDLVPHAVYGLCTVAAYEHVAARGAPQGSPGRRAAKAASQQDGAAPRRVERGTLEVLATSRLLLGAGLILAPRLVARTWVGEAGRAGPVAPLARALGARDLAIALGTLANRTSPRAARDWLLAGVLSDATDAVATLLSYRHLPRRRRLVAAASGTVAASMGLRAVASLGRGRRR
jgi:hypothetical protein